MATCHDIINDAEHRADPNYIPNKARAGRIGCHNRWHLNRAKFQRKCELCWAAVENSDLPVEQKVEAGLELITL